jgi:predicted lysophospholipase L1 biosynthesis ABC-type transport system permease subunit
MDRLLRIRTGKHPHEILVVFASSVLGLAGSIAPHRISIAIHSEFAYPWAMVFWMMMAIFSLITLYGILNHRVEGMLIERAGLIVLSALYGMYVFAVLSYAGWMGVASTVLPLAFAIGNLSRCWQIRTDLALLTSYLRDHPGDQVR